MRAALGILRRDADEERRDARELIVGASIDSVFGPVILFGQGGTSVEVVADRAVALPGFTEDEVLRLVAKGLTARQVAERLVLSHRTVENHVQNTLTKLALHNRSQLVRYALEQGLAE